MSSRRFYVAWYNQRLLGADGRRTGPRPFENSVVWLRVGVRLRRWHDLGGVWFGRHWPFVKLLLPSRPAGPPTRVPEGFS